MSRFVPIDMQEGSITANGAMRKALYANDIEKL